MRITDLEGKTVLVTGASTGIGAAVAKGFAAQGARVAVHCNSSRPAAEEVAAAIRGAGGSAIVLQADVRSVEACTRLVNEAHAALGGLDVLVNNAGGVVKRLPLREIEDALYDDIVQLNAAAAFLVGDKVETLRDGVRLAGDVIDDGRARGALDRLLSVTGR
jgi:3-oxoacyl-[acyl-carrier protein] reductase